MKTTLIVSEVQITFAGLRAVIPHIQYLALPCTHCTAAVVYLLVFGIQIPV